MTLAQNMFEPIISDSNNQNKDTHILNQKLRDVINSKGHENFRTYIASNNITTLSLASFGYRIRDKGAKQLGEALKGTQVKKINLMSNSITYDGMRDFGEALKHTQITHVNLSINIDGGSGALMFIRELENTQVTHVYLANNNINDVAAKFMGEALKNTGVTFIDLSYNNLGSQGIIDFGQSLKSTKITKIDLTRNNINSDNMTAFAKTLRETHVMSINLSSNPQISSQAAKDFCLSLRETNVTEVNFEWCEFNNQTILEICEILKGTKIQSIIFDKTLPQNIMSELNAMYVFNRSLKGMALASLAQAPEQAVLLKSLPSIMFQSHYLSDYDRENITHVVNDTTLAIPATELQSFKNIIALYESGTKKQRVNDDHSVVSVENDFVNPLLYDEHINTDITDDEKTEYNSYDSNLNSKKRPRN